MSGLSSLSSAALADASDRLHFEYGQLVYREGERATGAYIVTSGKVKLVACSAAGKVLIIRVAKPGDLIGLSAALSGCQNDTTAIALEPTVATYIPTDSLYRLMSCLSDLSLWLAQQLSIEYYSLCQELSLVGLRRSAMSKLANLLMGFVENTEGQRGAVQIKCRLTHEEMAQMIGTSRETVTRLLRELRESAIATFKGDLLQVNDLQELRVLTIEGEMRQRHAAKPM